MSGKRRSRGVSLIEVVVFIVVLGIGISGVVMLYGRLTTASVDPLVRKQALAIAVSLMEEIQLRGFTYCDPDDPNVSTANGIGATLGCTSAAHVENIGPDTLPASAVETRYADPRFDNVNDYHGFAMAGANIRDVTNTPISGLGAYAASVNVANIGAGELPAVASVADALRITVTVTGPTGVNVVLQGYRLRYAPNTP